MKSFDIHYLNALVHEVHAELLRNIKRNIALENKVFTLTFQHLFNFVRI